MQKFSTDEEEEALVIHGRGGGGREVVRIIRSSRAESSGFRYPKVQAHLLL